MTDYRNVINEFLSVFNCVGISYDTRVSNNGHVSLNLNCEVEDAVTQVLPYISMSSLTFICSNKKEYLFADTIVELCQEEITKRLILNEEA